MKIDVQTQNEDGGVAFNATLNKAEVNTLLQYAVNNLLAMGFIFENQVLEEDDEETVRIKRPEGQSVQ